MKDYKVSEMPYKRPNKDEVIARIEKFGKDFDDAKTSDQQVEILKEYCEFADDLRTLAILASIRFSQNTEDEFNIGEHDFWDEVSPEIELATVQFQGKICNSKFRKDLEKIFTPVFFERVEMSLSVADERLLPLQVEEGKLVSEYTKLMSSLMVDYNGETLPPSGIVKYATNPDRNLREGAYTALGKKYMEVADQIDDLFDKLVKNRTAQGKILGYESFSPLGYANMLRTCYNKDDIAKFRGYVKQYLVPLVAKIKNKIRDEQNWDRVTMYDDSIFTDKCCDYYGTVPELFEKAQKMYDELSPDTSKLFRHMREIEAFDVESRKGKWGGGFMEEIPKYKTPFILANFNGSLDDIGTFTHEFGHSLNGYFNFQIPFEALLNLTMETAEVHSMSMEFLTYPWMEMFFKDRTNDYFFSHIAGAISFIPYGTIVDAFQQEIYDNPNLTPEERLGVWKRLEKDFLPYMDNEGIPFYGDGRVWQRQAHIFEMPFYYIDYCLAQVTAFQFLALAEKNREEAVDKYMKFSRLGPTRSFVELLRMAGLKTPFEEDTFKDIVAIIEKKLNI